MSKLLTVFDGLNRTAVGFDRIFDEMLRLNSVASQQNYPPYNIVRTDEDHYDIEIAVSGFKESDLDVTVQNGQLIITGEVVDEDTREYLHRGIAARKFVRQFYIADTLIVKGAAYNNGILTITLEMVIPEEKKPKKIAINNK